ncbi:MAG: terminase family protein [Patescibacteria group bacterium]|nr:terminase family protein [Patescibacteria group bacterium]
MSTKRKTITPLDGLLPYQRKWIDDGARFKIGLMARQTGKSWTSAMESVRDCLERKTTWVCMSAGERQSLEWMAKVREHIEAFKVALAGYEEDRGGLDEALLKVAEARFPNGSRVLAIPANPATARGYSANILLDEFAHHEDPDAIWRAVYPSISNPLKGVFKIRVVSTPNGLGNKFADLWTKGDKWSKHHVDIYEAVKSGLPVDIEELKAGLDDPEGWAQEYECQFIDAAAVLLPYELIALCESSEATTAIAPEWWMTNRSREIYIGWDFARKKDLSVPVVGELLGDVLWTREVIEYRGMSTPDQVDAMADRIAAARRVSVDYTGPGIGLGDLLVKRFGQYDPEKHLFGKIELVTFTQNEKLKLFPALRVAFEQQRVRVPVNRTFREDLHSMQRVTTLNGNVTYRAPHTQDGHADRCTGLALCLRARGTAGSNLRFIPPTGRRARIVSDRQNRSILA